MNVYSLKQSEIFAFLAALFLIIVVFSERQLHENPPIIILSEENEAFRFPSGSASVTEAFSIALQERIIPELDRLSKNCACDSIEIIGHTDNVPVKRTLSSMDFVTTDMRSLIPGSNFDLGIMRALSVMKILTEAQNNGALQNIKYFSPYSAGQLSLPSRDLSWGSADQGDQARRRIEVRLTRSNQTHHIDF